ncbi:MAG: CHAD domain-containing protein [Acidiferrobacterales bacterium]
MQEKQLHFDVPQDTRLTDLKARLTNHIDFVDEPPVVVRRTFYDSFDWRIYEDDSVLEVESAQNGESRLRWRTLGSGESYASLRIVEPPRFAWDLPHGLFRQDLGRLLRMRALLPRATVHSRRHTLKLLNKNGKTVLRAFVEENSLLDRNNKKNDLVGIQIRVLPVKGYRKPLEQVLRALEEDLGLSRAEQDVMLMALSALGIQPASYSSRLDLPLDPMMRTDQAVMGILRHILRAMERNAAGTEADIDTECLHDLRVAVRRTRSALREAKGVFAKATIDRFRTQFAWLGRLTGPTRDLDVYLLSFDDYRASLPASLRGDVMPLLDFLCAHRAVERKNLIKGLESSRYQKLMKGWRAFLEAPVPERAALRDATRPVAEVASDRIRNAYARVLSQGLAIGAEAPAEPLHELRKKCKALRYLMEFFRSLYPAEHMVQLIDALKELQDNLGDIQDLQVQANTLKEFSRQMQKEGKVSADTLMAMGILVQQLEDRQRRARAEFQNHFGHFSAQANQQLFGRLFAPAPVEALATR